MSLQQFATYKSADFVLCDELLGETSKPARIVRRRLNPSFWLRRMLTAGTLIGIVTVSQKREPRIAPT
jgi:hypothetical protein